MIDTIKLAVRLNKPLRDANLGFTPRLDSISPEYFGYFRAYTNNNSLGNDKYYPRLTYVQRPVADIGVVFELLIEASLPKLYFGENFSELGDNKMLKVAQVLLDRLKEMGFDLDPEQILNADVRKIDFSKNIIFFDTLSVTQSLANSLSKVNVHGRYDWQHTSYVKNNSRAFHIHSNSLDVVLYDKIADLRSMKVSPKRSMETSGMFSQTVMDKLEELKPISVPRFEVRLNGKKIIKSTLKKIGEDPTQTTYSDLFSSDIARKVLLSHWDGLVDTIPKTLPKKKDLKAVYLDILKEDRMTPMKSFARLGFVMLATVAGLNWIKDVVCDRFSRFAWGAVKGLDSAPSESQMKDLDFVREAINEMKPINIWKVRK
ncbi:MAG: hypothetical protein LBG75_00140 [Candidatus Nomurabacteria bacterium]|nr:hypothetical protein [Candidatus Nomurabacteria bacterium]